MRIADLIQKSENREPLSRDEICALLKVPLFSPDAALIASAARAKSEAACGGWAEVHAQVGLNIYPCPKNCKFCAFAAINKIFHTRTEIGIGEAVTAARRFEKDGANAVFIMSTADYPFAKFLEVSREIRRSLSQDTVLVANVGDFSLEEAKALKAAGYAGVYHALRLGEGKDTKIPPEQRLRTFRHAHEAGLLLGTCVEPVGPEHTPEEIAEKTIVTRDAKPVFSGAARRIILPDTELSRHGMISEARMAHLVSVVRLALGPDIPGNCTHEPCVIGAAAGANLLWAEEGSNPRDTESKTEGARGMTVAQCRKVLEEAEWKVLAGPSRFYRA
jgi:biotin synthase